MLPDWHNANVAASFSHILGDILVYVNLSPRECIDGLTDC
jgi:hypothetical protein